MNPLPPSFDTNAFPCLMCDANMTDAGKQWECPRCGFFYRPLVPGTVPRKYRQGEANTAKKMCRECGKVEVRGIRKFCGPCATRRKRASTRQAQQKRRFRVRKTGFSPIGAEALTTAD